MYHRSQLTKKLTKKNRESGVISEYFLNNSLSEIFKKIDAACDDDLKFNKDDSNFPYQISKKQDSFPVSNISGGLKVFLLIKTLLLNGGINYGDVVILDEPEIQLHPE